MKIAVIGAGAAGLAAAWALSRQHDVTLFEAEGRLGGHARTVDVEIGHVVFPVDTGFIVYNETNYPEFTRLLAALDVPTLPSDMSFSVSIAPRNLEYAGNARGLFAQRRNLWRPEFWRLLRDIQRFNGDARRFLASSARQPDMTLGEFLAAGGYGSDLADCYLLPMAAAIWSSSNAGIRQHPAENTLGFFANHGLLRLRGRPRWRTIRGGSRSYVARLRAAMSARLRSGCAVQAVRREASGVRVVESGGRQSAYDHIVFATHADETLRILGDQATPAERRTLGAIGYQSNRAILHRDRRLMPGQERAWASWNYLSRTQGEEARVSVTYWMNRLQSLPVSDPVLVTLNPPAEPAEALVLGEQVFRHPQLDRAARRAQASLPSLQGAARVWYCGAYWGHGFHEDAIASGLAVAAALGSPAPWQHVDRTAAAAVLDSRIAAAAQ